MKFLFQQPLASVAWIRMDFSLVRQASYRGVSQRLACC
jgi:hypothetical protein